MLFIENGKNELPVIILLHGGGLSSWALAGIIELLKDDYHIITPIIDGHGEDGENNFISIEDSAKKLLDYIEKQFKGNVFALGGLSIGAQIVIEALSKKEDIAQFIILESALILPIAGIKALTVPVINIFYGLLKNKWFSKIQSKSLLVSENIFEQYYHDSLKISKTSLVNIILSNGSYSLKPNMENAKMKALILAGEKEINLIKKSAKILNQKIKNSELKYIKNAGHGELSMKYPEEYVKIIKNFFNQK
ncbi:MAG: alpha/beta hydrolase [Treponema sp.]|nr:alpha/beta hydrolase [Treponema sp.]MCL2271446.1 alpha/beta hydrolase [Treponema sp.]